MTSRGPANAFSELSALPLVVAPMGAGPSTPTLVVAASNAGAFGFLAAAYKTPEAVEAEIAAVRAESTRPFGVNVFVPGAPTPHRAELDRYARDLAAEADALGVEIGAPTWDDDHWGPKTELLLAAVPAVCSFTFGCPDPSLTSELQRRGSLVVVTVTSAQEAAHAVAQGVDGLCVQGIEAGAHRGCFVDDERADEGLGLLALLGAVRVAIDVPIVAAGGIMRPEQVDAALAAGATAVQTGTAFLRCDESGAHALHQDALVDPEFTSTALTRSFTGRRARGLVNRFLLEHPDTPAAYPEINNLTRPLRAAAVARADAGGTNLWAGTGHREARTGSAASIVAWLTRTGP